MYGTPLAVSVYPFGPHQRSSRRTTFSQVFLYVLYVHSGTRKRFELECLSHGALAFPAGRVANALRLRTRARRRYTANVTRVEVEIRWFAPTATAIRLTISKAMTVEPESFESVRRQIAVHERVTVSGTDIPGRIRNRSFQIVSRRWSNIINTFSTTCVRRYAL